MDYPSEKSVFILDKMKLEWLRVLSRWYNRVVLARVFDTVPIQHESEKNVLLTIDIGCKLIKENTLFSGEFQFGLECDSRIVLERCTRNP